MVVTTNGFALNHDKSLQIYFFCLKHQAKNDFLKDVVSNVGIVFKIFPGYTQIILFWLRQWQTFVNVRKRFALLNVSLVHAFTFKEINILPLDDNSATNIYLPYSKGKEFAKMKRNEK